MHAARSLHGVGVCLKRVGMVASNSEGRSIDRRAKFIYTVSKLRVSRFHAGESETQES